jgi:hypothetical protein
MYTEVREALTGISFGDAQATDLQQPFFNEFLGSSSLLLPI